MTNGIVSMVKGGQVVIKAVCGCDGYNAPALAHLLKQESEVPELEAVHRLALDVGFGCEDCLVVQGTDRNLFLGEDDLSPLYREKFGDPSFNPRWERGTCGNVEVVTIG